MSTSSYIEIAGASGSRSKEGVVQWNVPYLVKTKSSINNLPSTYEGCQRVGSTWTCNHNGPSPSYIANVTYEGPDEENMNSGSGDEYSRPVWSIDFDLKEMPIESHWNLTEIKKKYGGYPDPDAPDLWKFGDTMPGGSGSSSGLSKGATKGQKANPMKGVRTYIVMLTTVSKSYTKRITPDMTSKIGKQMTSLPNAPAGFDKLGKGKRSWIQMPPQVTKRGKVWEITDSWRLSEYFEWPDKVYEKFEKR